MKIARLILVLSVFFTVTGKSAAQLSGNGGGGNATSLQFGANAPIPNDTTNPASGNFLQVSGGKIVGAAGTGATSPGSTAGAIQYNNGGSAFGGVVINGIVKANGASAPTAAVAKTDYAPATSGTSLLVGDGLGGFGTFSGNTLAAHNFGSQISAAGVLIGSQPACSDLTGAAASCGTNATELSSGTVPAARLPNPSASTLGGVQSKAVVTHQYLNTISTAGVPGSAQPICADLSDSAASCATDATNATNISSGTLPAARLPNPSASTLGGTQSIATATHNFLTGISTSGVPSKAQPASTDLSDLPIPVSSGGTQCGAAGIFSALPGSPADGTICTVTDALSCSPGDAISVGGGTIECQITWFASMSAWIAGGNGQGGGSFSGQLCTASTCAITKNFVNASAAANAIAANLPASAGTFKPVQVCKTDSSPNAVTINPNGTDTINSNGLSFILNKQFECAALNPSATGNWTLTAATYPVTQTLAPHNFATQLSVNGVMAGAQPMFSDIAGMNTVAQGGTGCGAAGLFATVTAAASQTSGTTCTITDAVTCNQGAVVTVGGGSTYCQITLLNGSWIAGGASSGGGSGGIATAVAGNPTVYTSATAVGGVAKIIHAGSGTLAAAFTALGANPGIVIADPGITYTVSAPLTWGASHDQTLINYGKINCTDTTGGRNCLAEDVHGHLLCNGIGSGAANEGIISNSSTANITSLVTDAAPASADGFDIRDCFLDPNTSGTITKAALWLSGVEGFATVFHVNIAQPGTAGSNSGIAYLVDDDGGAHQWNQIDNTSVSVALGNATGVTGVSIIGSVAGLGGQNFTWAGGSIVDGAAGSTLLNIDGGGSGGTVQAIWFNGTYFETAGAGNDIIKINNATNVNLRGVQFVEASGGVYSNCLHITGTAANFGYVHMTGRMVPSACTDVVNNAVSGYTNTAAGDIDYTYYGSNGSGPIVDGPKAAVLAAKAAAISSCGSGTLATGSNAYFGRITMTGVTSCILTPGFTCPNAVEAQLTDDSLAGGASISAQSTTTVTIAATAGNIVDYAAGCR